MKKIVCRFGAWPLGQSTHHVTISLQLADITSVVFTTTKMTPFMSDCVLTVVIGDSATLSSIMLLLGLTCQTRYT